MSPGFKEGADSCVPITALQLSHKKRSTYPNSSPLVFQFPTNPQCPRNHGSNNKPQGQDSLDSKISTSQGNCSGAKGSTQSISWLEERDLGYLTR